MSTLEPAIEKQTGDPATASIIWLHGLGADGHDFSGIIPQLGLPAAPALRFIFPHAPRRPVTINHGYVMRAWYDILGEGMLRHEDAAGIQTSASLIEQLIAREIERGIPSQRIFLAGFSQGGAMVLHVGLRHASPLGGVIALSTYLPLAATLPLQRHPANAAIPILMIHGDCDDIIPLPMAEISRQALEKSGYHPQWRCYPGMGHSVCIDEIQTIGRWLVERLGN
ncbi:MAG: dienelactone hydrolase family protein [Gammaproteobacteria bacterium]|nr:dienelactone hydrolase family protein [Gammaproteobacteria bacterium]